MTVRQQLIAKTKKKQCIYCGKWRLIGELQRIDHGAWQCPEHDTETTEERLKRKNAIK